MRYAATGAATLPFEMVKQLGASIAGTAVHFGLLSILVGLFHAPPVWASTGGAAAGALVIYLMSYFMTFRSTKEHSACLSKFFLVAAFGALVNGSVLSAAMSQMHWSLLPAQMLASGIQFSICFGINRMWTF